MVAVASTTERPLLPDAEGRLAEFTELLAAAIANAQSREDLTRLAEEQAALRRVATLVARGGSPESLFAVVAEQVSRALHVPLVNIVRYEDDGTATECASFSKRGDVFAVGTRWSLDGTNVIAVVRETGRPARINDYSGLEGAIAASLRRVGIHSRVGVPIIVAGRLCGATLASPEELEPLPTDTEARLAKFTELVATAIADSEAQAEVSRLADEHAALRRVATLVARGLPPTQVFVQATEAVGRLLGADAAGMIRYDSEELASAVATWAAKGEHASVGSEWPLEGDSLAPTILRGPGRSDRRLGRRSRAHRGVRPRARIPLLGRHSHRVRGPRMGCPHGSLQGAPAASGRDRIEGRRCR
jgi:GAF domain-containing protein